MNAGFERKGKLFVLSGPSGTGKGTICREIIKLTGAALSVSMTTRMPRRGETQGKSYFFVTEADFKATIEENGFIEYAEVYGCYYGTQKKWVFDQLSKGRDVILEIDTQGAAKVKQSYPESILIFVLPPSLTELRRRIEKRGSETEESLGIRMSNAKKEIAQIGVYDYYVVNKILRDAIDSVRAIMSAERLRTSELPTDIADRY